MFGRLTASAVILLALYSCSKKPEYPASPGQGDVIKINLKGLKKGEPLFLSLPYNSKRIDFFVLRINGTVQSYFDACIKCYPKKLGYRLEGGSLICKACGMRYPIEGLKGVGSCYPIGLEGRVEGENYIIEKETVIEGWRYF
ncbi:MAG: Fe-S-containing protein [Thermodesulfovibrionales bacterium]|nr:Fe-S-containing protein [Thermodesulfovibrionales bacterium]